MVEHERRDHQIERSGGVLDPVTKSLLEADFCTCSFGFLPRAGEGLGVRIESCDFNSRIPLLEQNRQRTRTASDVQNAFAIV